MNKNLFPALASFFIVGLGQIIQGKAEIGLKLLLTYFFIIPGIIFTCLLFQSGLIVLLISASIIAGIVLWLYSIWRALTYHEKSI